MRSDSGMGTKAKKSEQEKIGGWGRAKELRLLLSPAFFPPLSTGYLNAWNRLWKDIMTVSYCTFTVISLIACKSEYIYKERK